MGLDVASDRERGRAAGGDDSFEAIFVGQIQKVVGEVGVVLDDQKDTIAEMDVTDVIRRAGARRYRRQLGGR